MMQNKHDGPDSGSSRRHEHPSTYFVQDRSNPDEMTRLTIQDQVTTATMGGVLPEQPHPERFRSVLDVGCGTGVWLVELAKQFPTIKRLVGVDISAKMLEYAREQAAEQGVSDRVEFQVMDAIRLLEFPADSFDLVNQRYGASYLRKWEWANVLREYRRVCVAGGTLRVTESTCVCESSGPALLQLSQLLIQAFYQAGYYFTESYNGITSQLAHLFTQHGVQQVHTHLTQMEMRAGTPDYQASYESSRLAFRTLQPMLRKWTRVPNNYEEIYQQLLAEMQQPDYVARWNLLTVWGMNTE